jgi:hypothetical protein
MPAEVDLTLPLPGLSPVCSKPIVARFDGGRLSSDGGVLLLAEVERVGWEWPNGWPAALRIRARRIGLSTDWRR